MSEGQQRAKPRPVLTSLAGYQRSWLGPDVLAALTLLVIAVPEQLATSRLAGMPPITGLFAFVAGTALFALLGSNPQLSVGADSTIAPLFAVALSHLAPTGSSNYVALAGILAVVVGVVVAAVGLLRLGWIAEFLSVPIISGFMAGVAVIIVVHQLPDVLGLTSVSGTTAHRVQAVLAHVGRANGWCVAISAGVLVAVVLAERVDRRLPGALVGLVGSTLAVGLGHLQRHGVVVLGAVAHGWPRLGVHGLSAHSVVQVLPVAGVVALVVISQSAATSRAFAEEGEGRPDIGRDFVGVGMGSVASGLVGSFPVDASPARTAAVESAGGRTQLSGLLAAAAVLVLVPAAGVLHDVPVATLGAVLIFVASRIVHWRQLAAIMRFDLVEFALAVVTLLTVALVGVEQGIAVAVGLAILDRTRLSARPSAHVLGRLPGTTSWGPVSAGGPQAEVPGTVVLLFAAPLYYANAEHFRAQVATAVHRAGVAPGALVLDVIGMHDIDFTGTQVLSQILDDMDKAHITVVMSRAGGHLRQNLEHAGLLARIGAGHFYPSVDEAVRAVSSDPSGT
ncbi:MAG TPA: SulP family inorganic anion transporter [Acidimicrobiales bacterium]|nr:SulP family inorganic anion transporter [Acidimicrobiales bacterium]